MQDVKHLEIKEVIDGRYEIRRLISSGGYGAVYLAYDQNLAREVALKVVHVPGDLAIDQELAKRLIREAQALSLLKHPGLIEIYRLGFLTDGRPFIVMEYVDTDSLDKTIRAVGPMKCNEVSLLAVQLALTLSHIHKQGVLHRDIKPQNVLVEKTATGTKARLVDFGLGSIKDELKKDLARLTMTGETVGTPQYMSPEQCRGEKLDERSDIYSLGLVMFEMIAGQAAFGDTDPGRVYHKQLYKTIPKLSQMDGSAKFPPVLQEILDKATAKKKEARYQTADDMLSDLRALCELNSEEKLDSVCLLTYAPRKRKISPLTYAAATIAAFVITIVGFIAWSTFTIQGEKTLANLIANVLPARSALPVIGAFETLQLNLRGPGGVMEFGKAVIECNGTHLWTTEEQFELMLEVFKHGGHKPPIDVFFPLALTALKQTPVVIPLRRENPAFVPTDDFRKGNNVARFWNNAEPTGNHVIAQPHWQYLEPICMLTQYLMDSRLSQQQWYDVYITTKMQGPWRLDLGLIGTQDSRKLYLLVEELAERASDKVTTQDDKLRQKDPNRILLEWIHHNPNNYRPPSYL